jgi:ABC-type lipoprotein release transport system permease subunit
VIRGKPYPELPAGEKRRGIEMAEETLTLPAGETRGGAGAHTLSIAWRNLWRNRRRTWLTSGGIAFAVWLLVFALSMQDGSFEIMVDNGARLALGHVQIQHPRYQDDPRVEYTLTGTGDLVARAEAMDDVTIASERAYGFALVNHEERSFGAQIFGVDAEREAVWSSLPGMLTDGRYLLGSGEAFIGSVLARNLGVSVGDEIVLLGTGKDGGVAAAVADVVGTFTSGQAELDRAVLQISIDDFREAWGLGSDEAHAVVILAATVTDSVAVAARLTPGADENWRALDWRALMPEAVQTIDIKLIGTLLFFGLIAIVVTFSIVNTFMMTVFERTPEFGMLMAIGMKPGRIMAQLSLEALFMAVLGVTIGLGLALALLIPLASIGMPLPESATEILNQYNMPDRMYPRFSVLAAVASAVIMVLGTQLAAFVPALRIRRMRPVEALRRTE